MKLFIIDVVLPNISSQELYPLLRSPYNIYRHVSPLLVTNCFILELSTHTCQTVSTAEECIYFSDIVS